MSSDLNEIFDAMTQVQISTANGSPLKGLDAIMSYDNIAIVVLMVVCLMETGLIYYLLKNLFLVKEVLASLYNAVTILNERLRHYD